MVVRDGNARHEARAHGIPGHVLPRGQSRRERESQPFRRAAAPLRACCPFRSVEGQAAARPAIGPRAGRPRRSLERRHGRAHRRLDVEARSQRVSHARGRARIRAGSRARTDATRPSRGRSRFQPQGAVGVAGELLLQRASARGAGPRRLRKGRFRRGRHRMARSRVVERDARQRCARLGLDRPQSRWRRRIDGLPDPRTRRSRALVERHASHARRALAAIHAAGRALSRAAHVELAAHRHRLSRRDGRGDRRQASGDSIR